MKCILRLRVMGWSCNDASSWEKERIAIEFVDEWKPKGKMAGHWAYVLSKMRPHQVMELLPSQMPIWAGLQSAEEWVTPCLGGDSRHSVWGWRRKALLCLVLLEESQWSWEAMSVTQRRSRFNPYVGPTCFFIPLPLGSENQPILHITFHYPLSAHIHTWPNSPFYPKTRPNSRAFSPTVLTQFTHHFHKDVTQFASILPHAHAITFPPHLPTLQICPNFYLHASHSHLFPTRHPSGLEPDPLPSPPALGSSAPSLTQVQFCTATFSLPRYPRGDVMWPDSSTSQTLLRSPISLHPLFPRTCGQCHCQNFQPSDTADVPSESL